MKRLKVMKKSIIALTIMSFAALMLSSCANEQEADLTDGIVKKGDLAISLAGTQTRSEASIDSKFVGETTSITFNTEDGEELTLDETVVNLNAQSMATRGTPAYTENVATLYGSFNAIMYNGTEVLHDLGAFNYDANDAKKRWIRHLYVEDPFAGVEGKMSIYMWMPTDMTNKGGVTFAESNGSYGTSGDNLTISFDYDGSKLATDGVCTATAQEDILFSGLKITKSEYDTALESEVGAPTVFFYHALTGVKFGLENPASDKVVIKSVTFNGLKDKGSCVVTTGPVTDYSSATQAVWDPNKQTATGTAYTQEYGATLQNFTTSDGKFGPTFYGPKSGKQNLNDANATQTFWFMPQKISEDVTLTITYAILNDKGEEGEPVTYTVNYGGVLAANNVEWKAGELRTYFIRIDEVNVQIEDVVDMAEKSQQTIITPWGEKQADSYEGSTKTDVVITNTGNTDAYIRVALIGQWRNSDGNPVFGFTDYTEGVQLVDSWYEDLFIKKTNIQGKFTDLPGANWVEGSDGYYYYKIAVPAGEEVPDELFTKYEVGECPAAAVAGEVQNIYFTLEIAVQAISAKKLDGSNYTYSEAWERALAME